jgi:S-adenosylmethionine hydrolase
MIITLTSDFGYKDAFVGIMKGVIVGINPQAHIVDLSHGIPPQDIMAAALLLRHSVKYFPPGTVHVAVVDPGVGSARLPILVAGGGQYLVGPDNGVLSLVAAAEAPDCVVHLSNDAYHLPGGGKTFHGRDVFAPVAAHLSLGVAPAALGSPLDSFERITWPAPQLGDKRVRGEIVYVDGFGNLFTNIAAADLRRFAPHELTFNCRGRSIGGLADHYALVPTGSLLALVNSWGVLEIAVNNGNAQTVCGAGIGDVVEVIAS